MRRTRRLRTLVPAGAAAMVALGAVGCGAASAGTGMEAMARAPHRAVAKTARNATLHKTVLVTRSGKTLYSLSAETHGKFICTGESCFSLWTPLVVKHGTRPTGVSLLATVKRPDGRTQVTYRGLPLYTFNEDRRPGDVKGNGFKDVGTWLAASATSGGRTAPARSAPAPGPYG
jgi:predicted lipoprotein with Yx(FWY)xxD motif